MTLPTSPPPALDDFVPATISGSGTRRARREALVERRGLELPLECPPVRPRRPPPVTSPNRPYRRSRWRRRDGVEATYRRAAKKAAQHGLGWPTLGSGGAAIDVRVHHFALGAQAVESRGIAGRLATSEHIGE